MNDMPFVKLFKSRYGYYIYDVNTNRIIDITEKNYFNLEKILRANCKVDDGEIAQVLSDPEFQSLIEKGMLKSKYPEKIEMPESSKLPYFLNHKLHILTLQVTQQCNFRCRYCHYTYGDDVQYHSHNSSTMIWATAKAAIDFFARRTRDSLYVTIGFYGGEPLLEYELVKKCIEYCQTVFEGKILAFAITTNAFLLTPEKAKFLIDNNTTILVSLDGPQEIHNKNRKNAGDGSGTFESVMNNLKKIEEELPEYYKKITYNSVVDPANDCGKVNNFFKCDMFKNRIIKTSSLQPTVGKRAYYSEEYISSSKKDQVIALLAKVKVFNTSEISTISKNYLERINMFERQMRSFNELPSIMGHSGPCKPGIFKLFVTTRGDLFPCERLKDNSNVMKIGSVFSTIDESKVDFLYNVGHVCDERCATCWNIRHCKICATKINDGKSLSPEMCAYECKYDCLETERQIKQMIAIREFKNKIYRKERCE